MDDAPVTEPPARRETLTTPRPAGGAVSSWVVLALLIVLAAMLYRYRVAISNDLLDADAEARVVAARGDLSESEKTQIEIFESASPSVVHIDNSTFRGRFGGGPFVEEVPTGNGTGFVWDERGYVVTNFHVVADMARGGGAATVELSDNSRYSAQLVGIAPEKDLAVLKISVPPGNLKPIPIGTSSDLRVGQNVYAIGSPFGLSQTFTAGVVSALDRQINSMMKDPISGVIQTDTAINPGNSGGPLLDSAGRLVGVNTAIESSSGANAGVGFAIPVDTVNEYVPELIRTGRSERAGLGVKLMPDAEAEANRRRYADFPQTRGAVVEFVISDSAADRAGLLGFDPRRDDPIGDVIVAIDGRPVAEAQALMDAMADFRPGEDVVLTVERGGQRQDVPVTLQGLSN